MSYVRHARTAALLFAAVLTSAWLGTRRERAQADDNPPAGRKLAFLVGVKEYRHAGLNDLDFPENDVNELADILKPLGFQVVVLTTELGKQNAELNPSAANIHLQLAKLLEKPAVGKRDLIVVGLAGHGMQPDKEAYFCPSDANPTRTNTLIGLGDLLKMLDDSGIGEKLVLVDACRNDPKTRGRRGIERVDVSALPPQTGVLLSCAPGEFAFEHKSLGKGHVKGHGVFFFHVIEGIKGDASDKDGDVTWDSLRAYVKKRVPQTVIKLYGKDGGAQRPNDIGNLIGESPELAVARITIPPKEPTMPMKEKPQGAPELLVAPFDEKEARAARKACAQYQQVEEERKNSIDMELVLIPAGRFSMGSPETADELMKLFSYARKEGLAGYRLKGQWPAHHVTISRPFYLGKYEVTKGQFKKFVEDTNYRTDAEKDGKGGWGYAGDKYKRFVQRADFTWRDWGVDQSDESPVVNVSHNDAVAFCEWLSRKEAKKYRLPTEAEWEYACRAGTVDRYYNGDDPEGLTKIANVWDAAVKEKLPQFSNYLSSSDGSTFTSPVGQFRPNNFGLYDMIGNASEWCSDWYDEDYYSKSPDRDPTGPNLGPYRVSNSGPYRVHRGGSWSSYAMDCRAASRDRRAPNLRYDSVGFRVARSSGE
jgi:formylglycine-generating enzyme required for sulfatase activity